MLKLRILYNRTTVIGRIQNIFGEMGIPKELNSDNAKEFTSKEFLNFCSDLGIKHHLTSVEKHKCNGRVDKNS